MPIQTVGKESTLGGKPFEPGTKSHGEAATAARERGRQASEGRGAAVGFAPTVGVETFFNLSDFREYEEVPDPKAAVGTALREATARGASDEELAAIHKKSPESLAKERSSVVSAKQMKQSFRHQNTQFPEGHWIVRKADGAIEVVSPGDFSSRFTSKDAGRPVAAQKTTSDAPKGGEEGAK